jgi:integrase
VSVPFYRIARRDGRVSFRVTWVPVEGRRQERTFPDLKTAKAFARTKAQELAQGVASGVVTLGAMENALAVAAHRSVEGSGWRLDHAISDWRSAIDLLPPGVTLIQAVRDYLTRHPQEAVCPPIPAIVDAFLAHKEGMGLSRVHLKDLRSRLGSFARTVRLPVGYLRVSHVEDWLASIKTGKGDGFRSVSARSRTNYLIALSNLVSFAERRGWLAKGALDLSVIERRRSETEIEVFTPGELARIFAVTPPPMIPFIALGAFAGLRHAEIRRMEWRDIGTEWVELRAAKTKTRAQRLVPVLPALKAWIEPLRKASGLVVSLLSPWNNLVRIATASGVAWKANGLRHSFGSYRLEMGLPEQQVASEMGNSPTIIFRHYRVLVTPDAAGRWFGIIPQTSST